MSYSIKYLSPVNKKYDLSVAKKKHYKVYISAVILLLLCGYFFLSNGQPPLLSFLLPGADAYTGKAIQAMLENIKAGEPVTDAMAAFCSDIITNAK